MRRRFGSDDSGMSAVEFAILSPILLTLVFGIIEFALILFTYNAAGHAAWDVTRQLATNRLTSAQASAAATSGLPSWVQSQATVNVQASSTDPTTNRYTVSISFPATAATPSTFLSWAYSTTTLTAQSTMQQEPTS